VTGALRRRRVTRSLPAALAALVVLAVAVVAVLAPALAPYDPNQPNLMHMSRPPGGEHMLGTDMLGRDVLSRLVYATRVSLLVAVTAVLINVTIGTLLGAAAGYFRGWLDNVLSRVADAFMSFPVLPLVIVLVALFGPSLLNVIVALALVGWPEVFRLVRGETLSVRERDFVQAAVSLGSRDARVIFKHVLPNVVAPVIVAATFGVAQAILTEAGLSFLGLGLRPPNASLGNMLLDAQSITVLRSHPWLWIPPGALIVSVVLSVNYLGDWLRSRLDPRLRSR
jgi:peptide/nickel transport system permease protein